MKALGNFDKELSKSLRADISAVMRTIKSDMKKVVMQPTPGAQHKAEAKFKKPPKALKSGNLRGDKSSKKNTNVRKSISESVTMRIQTTRARDAHIGIYVDMGKFYAKTNVAQTLNGTKKRVNRAPMLYAYNKESWTANHGGVHHGRPYFGRTIRKHQDGLEKAVQHAIDTSISELQKHI